MVVSHKTVLRAPPQTERRLSSDLVSENGNNRCQDAVAITGAGPEPQEGARDISYLPHSRGGLRVHSHSSAAAPTGGFSRRRFRSERRPRRAPALRRDPRRLGRGRTAVHHWPQAQPAHPHPQRGLWHSHRHHGATDRPGLGPPRRSSPPGAPGGQHHSQWRPGPGFRPVLLLDGRRGQAARRARRRQLPVRAHRHWRARRPGYWRSPLHERLLPANTQPLGAGTGPAVAGLPAGAQAAQPH